MRKSKLMTVPYVSLLAAIIGYFFIATSLSGGSSVPLIAFCVLMVLVYLLLAVYLMGEKKRPLVLCCCAVLGLCLAQTISFVEPLMDECRVTVLDVGQGQCILLQSNGLSYLVDCGGDSDEGSADLAAATLLAQGIARLDGVIVTHGDRDHAGGIGNLLDRVETDILLLPGYDEPVVKAELEDRTAFTTGSS